MEKIKAALLLFWQGVNKRALIIVSAALLVCVAGGVSVGVYANSPEVVTANAISKFAEDITERSEIEVLLNVLKGGSVKASVSSILHNDGLPWQNTELLEGDDSLSGKVYFSEKALMVEKLNINSGETSIALNAYLSDKLFYVKEDNIIKDAYGATYDKLAENLKNSIFAYGSDSDYAIEDKEAYDSIIKSLENPVSEEMRTEAEKIAKAYAKDIYKIIRENAEFESTNKDIRIGSEKISARVISISIDEEALEKMLREVYDYVENDVSVINYIEKHKDTLEIYVNYSEDGEELDAVELYEKYVDELGEEIDNTIEQMKEDEENQSLCFELVTPKMSSTLIRLTVKIDGEEHLTFEAGIDGIRKSDEITLSAGEGKIVYKVNKNDKKNYSAALEVNSEEIFSINISLEDESFEVMYMVDGDGATVSGTISSKKGVTTIKAQNIVIKETYCSNIYTGELSEKTNKYETDLEIIINEKDKIPAAPTEYKTIDKIKDADIEMWIENIGNIAD